MQDLEHTSGAADASSEEERLRLENLELKRQIERLRDPESHSSRPALWKPSSITIWTIVLATS